MIIRIIWQFLKLRKGGKNLVKGVEVNDPKLWFKAKRQKDKKAICKYMADIEVNHLRLFPVQQCHLEC